MGSDAAAEEQFGPYLVYERLGIGGMATVHRALERGIEGFERIVALKRLLPHLAADASFIKSFVREAKLASLLNHVNIVQIFECGRVGPEYFISMEYIEGRDIRRILRNARRVSGPPPIDVIVGLLLQLCEALDYAHNKSDDTGQPLGLVHRDLSPSNVLVTTGGQVKIIDFGVAKAQTAQLRTQSGRFKGKLAYMAPEVLAGKELDARSDLFATGIICHELLTARPLFATRNDYQTMMKIQRGDIMPPSTFNQQCPAELDAIVLRALARDREERFQQASDLRDELVALRKQYNLAVSARDIAAWLDWAFALEAPAARAVQPRAPSKTDIDVRPAPSERPSRARRSDEEEAVEVAWGGGDDAGNGEPIVLDDVPDVTDKHLATATALGAEVRLDLDDLADGIPTPNPAPAARPPSEAAQRAMAAALIPSPAPRIKRPTPAVPVRGAPVAPAPAARDQNRQVAAATSSGRGVQEAIAARNSDADPTPRGGALSSPRTHTPAPRILPSSTSQRTVPSLSPPPPSVPTSPPRGLSAVPAPPRNVPSGSVPPREGDLALGSSPRDAIATLRGAGAAPRRADATARARPVTQPGTGPRRLETPTTIYDAGDTLLRADSQSAELVPFSVDDPSLASDTIPSMPLMRTSEPVVRFHEPTTLPPHEPDPLPPSPTPPASAALSPAVAPPPSAAPPPSPAPAPQRQAPTASPAPQRQAPTASPAPQRPDPGSQARIVTPATALFAEPDPEVDTIESVPSHTVHEHEPPDLSASAIEDAARAPRRRAIWHTAILLALAALGAATTATVLHLMKERQATPEVTPPEPTPRSATVGTVRFAVVPADAAIAIEGVPEHRGTPWNVELAPGVYQIEIHRDGYMGWLTSIDLASGEIRPVHVTLEPLGAAVADATLRIASTPPGLEVVIDGVPAVGRTPLRLSVPAGSHSVVLRMNGADVWRKAVEARANAVHEIHPTIARPAERTPTAAGPAETSSAPPPAATPPAATPPAATPPAATPPAATPPAATPPAAIPPAATSPAAGATEAPSAPQPADR